MCSDVRSFLSVPSIVDLEIHSIFLHSLKRLSSNFSSVQGTCRPLTQQHLKLVHCCKQMSVTDPHEGCFWCFGLMHDTETCDAATQRLPEATGEHTAMLLVQSIWRFRASPAPVRSGEHRSSAKVVPGAEFPCCCSPMVSQRKNINASRTWLLPPTPVLQKSRDGSLCIHVFSSSSEELIPSVAPMYP